MIDLREHLNSSQYAAVTTIDGPLLVIAGAGTGKTRVIEYRVYYLVSNGINPESILLLTFTRKAAKEMLSRAARHDPKCKNVEGGTFHSFANKILREYVNTIGISNSFSILDTTDSEELIEVITADLGFRDMKKRFPEKKTLRNIISMSINKNISIKKILEDLYPYYLEYTECIEKIGDKYTEYKLKKDYLDYDDLLLYLKIILEENDRVREKLSKKYRYIMIDEYQDTNHLQGEIAYLLAKDHKNIMVVGDDAQSIYRFRGATHENIMNFPKLFPECKIITLEENYRSVQPILDVANAVLDNMKNKYQKKLVSASKEIGQKPRLRAFINATEEAEWVANKIKEFRDDGIPLNKQAVLFRASYLSFPLQNELNKRKIPFKVFGGLKFSETEHVKDVISHLRILINVKDELAWNRVLGLVRNIGRKTAAKLYNEISNFMDLDKIIEKVFSKYRSGYNYSEGLAKLALTLSKLVVIKKAEHSISEYIETIIDYYRPILETKHDNFHNRLLDLEGLKQISDTYSSLEDFLTAFALEPPERSLIANKQSVKLDEKPLVLSTIHSAKGLEWEVVFLIALRDDVFPSFHENSIEELEEEHRLFYVAITRAKKYLFLTFYNEGETAIKKFSKMSRFIDNPNVLSKLNTDFKDISSVPPTEKELVEEKVQSKEPEPVIYNKESLLDKIKKLFKK